MTKWPSGNNLLLVDPPEGRRVCAGWTQVVQPEIPQPTSLRKYRSRSTGVGMRKRSAVLGRVSTLDNLAPGCFFEKLSLGYCSLSAGPLTDRDFDHRRRSGQTRMRQVPNAIIDRIRFQSRSFAKICPRSFVRSGHLHTEIDPVLLQCESTLSLTEEHCDNRHALRLS